MATLSLGVLVSGSGTNLQAILNAIAEGSLDATVAVVISNRPDAKAIERARGAGVRAICIDHRQFGSRLEFDRALLTELDAAKVDWVVLAGFMRLLTPEFLERYRWRVINIHPALLPAFPGVNAARQALDYGVAVTGCTVHLVDEGTDTGPILAQRAIDVRPDDTEASLLERLHQAEHTLFVDTLRMLSRSVIEVEAAPGGRNRARSRPR